MHFFFAKTTFSDKINTAIQFIKRIDNSTEPTINREISEKLFKNRTITNIKTDKKPLVFVRKLISSHRSTHKDDFIRKRTMGGESSNKKTSSIEPSA